eukprot:679409-Ditylum_brightwellii.AAC.1
MGCLSNGVEWLPKDFPAHNGNLTQPLNVDELLDILKFGVPARWRRKFTVQVFDPLVEFCTCLESCEPSKGESKGEKPSKPKTMGRHKAKVLTTSTTSPAGQKLFYCKMHGRNRPHNTGDCFELKQYTKRVKANMSHDKADEATYKDLNAFVNAKVTPALNKAKKSQKKRKKKVTINAFNKFCSLNAESSNEESKPEVHAPAADDNNDSSASHLLSDDSKSNTE